MNVLFLVIIPAVITFVVLWAGLSLLAVLAYRAIDDYGINRGWWEA